MSSHNSKRREYGTKTIFEEKMAENFLELVNVINSQIREDQDSHCK